jgi:glycine oxidase
VKTWDVVIIGAGVIGISLAIELRRSGMSVMVLEKHQPGREASWAAGGMLVDTEAGDNESFRQLAKLSATMYPEFVHRLEDESGISVDLRSQGTIRFLDEQELESECLMGNLMSVDELRALEPALEYSPPAVFLEERCLDPRLLMEALVRAAKHLAVDIASGSEVVEIEVAGKRAVAAVTTRSRYPAEVIVNCAGAWAEVIGPVKIPTIPVKGQMLAITPVVVKHVVRGNGVYLIPRSNGRLVIGSTVEQVGYDKRVFPETIQRLHQSAAVLAPEIGLARILEDWAGLRPGTPDKLPIMGRTPVDGYFVSTGHYRDGILLSPISARLMAQMIKGEETEVDLSAFSLSRF